MLEVLQVQLLGADKGEDATRGPDDDMRAVGLEHLLVLADGQATKEHGNLIGGKKDVESANSDFFSQHQKKKWILSKREFVLFLVIAKAKI